MPRQRWLMGCFAITLALVAWTALNGDSEPARHVDPSVARGARRASDVAEVSSLNTNLIVASAEQDRDPIAETTIDPFAPVSFLPPPSTVMATVAPTPPPPPKPVAPPFPFRYFGKMANVDGKLVIYLARDEILVPINEKQILESVYRIDSVTETRILITYLPLNEQSAITIQSAAQ